MENEKKTGNPSQIKNVAIFSIVVIVSLIIFLGIYLSFQNSIIAPGVSWKVLVSSYPEIKAIKQKFIESCEIPLIDPNYFIDAKENKVFQQMREDCKTLDTNLEEKYTAYESSSKNELEWAKEVKPFFGVRYALANTENLIKNTEKEFNKIPSDSSQTTCGEKRITQYVPRLGCFQKHVSEELEKFAETKIDELMKRLGLSNRLNHKADNRGSTYMPPGVGFMEMHSNRNHFAGWRLYMHHLPDNGNSWFSYRHPYDGSYRKIYDENERMNMFRIRKPPDNVMWHAIFSDTHRFSWGLWIPPELAQHLKQNAHQM
jgi:hypothetical protein